MGRGSHQEFPGGQGCNDKQARSRCDHPGQVLGRELQRCLPLPHDVEENRLPPEYQLTIASVCNVSMPNPSDISRWPERLWQKRDRKSRERFLLQYALPRARRGAGDTRTLSVVASMDRKSPVIIEITAEAVSDRVSGH